MAKLKLSPLLEDKPVRLTVELLAATHRDLVAYADALGRETGEPIEPVKLVAPILHLFIATDRGFASVRKHSRKDDRPKAHWVVPAHAPLREEEIGNAKGPDFVTPVTIARSSRRSWMRSKWSAVAPSAMSIATSLWRVENAAIAS
jgi:hypothetical protein